jgi:hypothetical protein
MPAHRDDPREPSRIEFEVEGLIHDDKPVGDKVTPTTSDDVTDYDLQNADKVIVSYTNADGIKTYKQLRGPILDYDQLIDMVDALIIGYYE